MAVMACALTNCTLWTLRDQTQTDIMNLLWEYIASPDAEASPSASSLDALSLFLQHTPSAEEGGKNFRNSQECVTLLECTQATDIQFRLPAGCKQPSPVHSPFGTPDGGPEDAGRSHSPLFTLVTCYSCLVYAYICCY